MTGALNQRTVVDAINAVGSGFVPGLTFGVRLNAQKHDGADAVRTMVWLDSCSCFRYSGQPYSPF